jgi:hypothetical protein
MHLPLATQQQQQQQQQQRGYEAAKDASGAGEDFQPPTELSLQVGLHEMLNTCAQSLRLSLVTAMPC